MAAGIGEEELTEGEGEAGRCGIVSGEIVDLGIDGAVGVVEGAVAVGICRTKGMRRGLLVM